MGYKTQLTNLTDVLSYLNGVEYRPFNEFEQNPALGTMDSVLLVGSNNATQRTSMESFMSYLNNNLKNFICWKPLLTEKGFTWQRSSSDESPGEIILSDVAFPMASMTQSGMIDKLLFTKLTDIDDANIVYKDELNNALNLKADANHTHDDYALKSTIPTSLKGLQNDAGFITVNDIPKDLSSFENDVKYLTAADISVATGTTDGLLSKDYYNILANYDTTMTNITKSIDDKVSSTTLAESVTNICSEQGYITPDSISIPLMSADKAGGAMINDSSALSLDNGIIDIKPFGVTNLIKNGDFAYYWSNKIPRNWSRSTDATDTTVYTTIIDENDVFTRCVKVTSGIGYGITQLITENFNDCTLSFFAKADTQRVIKVSIGNVTHDVTLNTNWTKHTLYLDNFNIDVEKALSFKANTDNDGTSFFIASVKCSIGNIETGCARNYDDVIPPHLLPLADLNTQGTVIPDGDTIIINNGKLSAKINAEAINVAIGNIESKINKVADFSFPFSNAVNSPILLKTAAYNIMISRIDIKINTPFDSFGVDIYTETRI